MSRPSTTRSIGGFEVSTTKLRPTAALKLAPKLMKIMIPALKLVPGLGPLISVARTAGAELTPALVMAVLGRLDLDQLVGSLAELLGTVDDATLDTLYREMLVDTSVTVPNDQGVLHVVELNTPGMIDLAFGGLDNGINLLVQTLIFVGEVNFKHSFFDLASRLGLKAKA